MSTSHTKNYYNSRVPPDRVSQTRRGKEKPRPRVEIHFLLITIPSHCGSMDNDKDKELTDLTSTPSPPALRCAAFSWSAAACCIRGGSLVWQPGNRADEPGKLAKDHSLVSTWLFKKHSSILIEIHTFFLLKQVVTTHFLYIL